MTDYREVTACRLCDSAELASVLDLGETPLANELDGTELFPLQVNRCFSCGHHQLSIAVSPERLWGPNYPYASGTSPVFRRHLEALADEVAALKPGGRVLEIASNDGTLVDMLSARGLIAVGYDPSGPDDPSRHLQRVSWPLKHFGRHLPPLDVIIALNVFAHVDDLQGFTAAVKEALAPDGVFILEVGYLLDVIAAGAFDTVYHEHMSYHTVRPLADFFEGLGLRIKRALSVDSQGGSIRLYVHHADEVPWFDVRGGEEPNVAALSETVRRRSRALAREIGGRFQAGESVCIYGAPAKLVTLLYATELQMMRFNCVGEDNPRKAGRTTPGNHIPIVSVEDMLSRKPDAILVAAWNFFDDIRDKLRRLGYAGDIINPMELQ